LYSPPILDWPFSQLITSLDRISYAAYLVEITDGLTGEREENPAAFQHLKEGLGLFGRKWHFAPFSHFF